MGLTTKQLFEESLRSKHSIASYSWYVNEYVKYYKLASWDSILEFPVLEIQQMIQTYIVHVKKRVSPNSVPTYLKPIKFFLELNDIELKWKRLSKLYPERIKLSGASAWQTEEVKKMLDTTNR